MWASGRLLDFAMPAYTGIAELVLTLDRVEASYSSALP
jgi:hypothetical protein